MWVGGKVSVKRGKGATWNGAAAAPPFQNMVNSVFFFMKGRRYTSNSRAGLFRRSGLGVCVINVITHHPFWILNDELLCM